VVVIVEFSWFPGAIVREDGEAAIVNVGRVRPSAFVHVANNIEVSRHREKVKRHTAGVVFIEISSPQFANILDCCHVTTTSSAGLTAIHPLRGTLSHFTLQ